VSLSGTDFGPGDGVARGHADSGGAYREPEVRPLAEIIEELNERFGLGLGTSDEILVYQQVLGLVEDPGMQQVGLMNDEARFGQPVRKVKAHPGVRQKPHTLRVMRNPAHGFPVMRRMYDNRPKFSRKLFLSRRLFAPIR
jgi:hypothetical protein